MAITRAFKNAPHQRSRQVPLVINGDMQIAQRGTADVTGLGDGDLHRWAAIRLRLPGGDGGCGLISHVATRTQAYLATLVRSIPMLLGYCGDGEDAVPCRGILPLTRYIEIFVPDTDTFEELVAKAEKVEEWTKRVKELENATII